MPDDTGYDPERVWRFLELRGRVRECDGRVMRLNGHPLPESYRITLAHWRERKVDLIPLGRWDEILLGADVMLWEYEQWEQETYGDLSYRDPAIVIENNTNKEFHV